MRRDVFEGLAIGDVSGADLDRGEPRKHVELGEEDLRQAIQARRVPNEDGVEPSAPSLASRGGAELLPRLPQTLAVGTRILGGERSRSDPGHVGFRDADHPVHLHRPHPGRGQGEPGHRVGGRDERIGPVVQVEERSLRPLEQDVLPGSQAFVEQPGRVGHVRSQSLAVGPILLDDDVGRERQPVVDLGQEEVLLLQDDLQLLPEDLRVEQILESEPDPSRLVSIGGPDAPLGRPQRMLAKMALGHLLQLKVIGHDQVRVARHDEARDVDPQAGQRVHLFQQDAGIHDHAVGDDRGEVGIQDPGGDEVKLQEVPLGHHGVSGVVATLVPDHEPHLVGQVVGDLALALVPPLGPDDDRGRHDPPAYRSKRNRISTCVWYSVILLPSTTAEVPRISIPSIPRIVFDASFSA